MVTIKRFTPTGVGTINPQLWGGAKSTVHPHGRGDNDARNRAAGEYAGSPPRAWGQSSRQPSRARAVRFTPTGVGTICGSRASG